MRIYLVELIQMKASKLYRKIKMININKMQKVTNQYNQILRKIKECQLFNPKFQNLRIFISLMNFMKINQKFMTFFQFH